MSALVPVVVSMLLATGAHAQSMPNKVGPADSSPPAPGASPKADSTPPWVTKRDLLGAGLSVLATVAVAPLDKPVSGELQEPGWQKDEPLHSASQVLAFAGGPGPFLLGAGLIVSGRLAADPGLSAVGVHATESVLLAASLTALGKGLAGRALPGVKTSEDFEWARGFHRGNGPYVSFPSGHTAAAFATAAALTDEAAAWRPGSQRYVGPATYITASAIGFARLYQNVHWVSDLPLAAAIGIWSGQAVEAHVHHRRHRSPVARIAELATIGPTSDGRMAIGMSMRFGAAHR